MSTSMQPFQEVASLQEKMKSLFQDMLGRGPLLLAEELASAWGILPPADIYEDEEQLTVTTELPGVEEKDLKVEIDNGVLRVSGERKLKDVKEENIRRKERRYGTFSRSFTLPASVDPARVEANYTNGVLTIKISKRADAKPKQIKVNISETLQEKAA
jgi:HSP20 family protein